MEGSGVFLALVGVRGSRDLRTGVRFSLLLLESELRRDIAERLCFDDGDGEVLQGLGVIWRDLTDMFDGRDEVGGECGRVG